MQSLHPAFASSYKRLAAACSRFGATLESPSGDGYVRRLMYHRKSIVFTAEALPLNTAAAQALARDKIATYQLLEAARLPIPHWFPFFGKRHLDIITNTDPGMHLKNLTARLQQHFPHFLVSQLPHLIVKPGRSSGGNGVARCTTMDEILRAAKHSLEFSYSGVVQEYVDGTDYRVVFLNNKLLVMTHDEQTKIFFDDVISTDVHDFVSKAQQALGLRYGSLDLRKKADGSFVILELNGNPGFDRLEKFAPDRVATITNTILHELIALLSTTKVLL
ncbi:hypothetical protein HY624_04000 [Candidatus Uhrbacteria bacterium]|nr:hypothetical protein [Candidatus Uhrbacteria bacterium]